MGMNVADLMELIDLRKRMMEEREAHLTMKHIIDDMMSEILMLDNPEAMREVALYVKELIA